MSLPVLDHLRVGVGLPLIGRRRLVSPAVRLRVRLQRGRLDQLLAEGAPPTPYPLIRERARQLTTRGARRRLAKGLEGAIRAAERPAQPFSAAVAVNRAAVDSARGALVALVDRLNSAEPVGAQGIVLTRRLLADPAGPLYQQSEADDLWDTAGAAFRGLEEGPRI
jgi:hypothetical protein